MRHNETIYKLFINYVSKYSIILSVDTICRYCSTVYLNIVSTGVLYGSADTLHTVRFLFRKEIIMREILFRGKCLGRLHKKGFVYGSLGVIDTDLVAIYQCKEFTEDVKFIVDIGTVGQYTGLTDKNGTKIFEDDIVKVTDDNGETNLCSCGIGDVCFYDGSWYIGGEVNDGLYDVKNIYYIEVIGNIYDNPELLKGGAE